MESSVWLELPPKKSFSCAFSSLASASTTSNFMSSHRYMKYWIESGNIISNDRFVLFLLCTEMKEEENKKTYYLVIGFFVWCSRCSFSVSMKSIAIVWKSNQNDWNNERWKMNNGYIFYFSFVRNRTQIGSTIKSNTKIDNARWCNRTTF